jgi:hypothetical protein
MHVLLSYLYHFRTCITFVHVLLSYMYHFRTCITFVHVDHNGTLILTDSATSEFKFPKIERIY